MTIVLDSKIPEGPLAEKWTNYKADQKLVSTRGKIKEDAFLSFVRNAVEQNWVEEGVLYHEH